MIQMATDAPKSSSMRRAYRIGRTYLSPRNWRKTRFLCPCCRYRGPFLDLHTGKDRRADARCPSCGALERHRLQRLVFDDLFGERETAGLAFLHFAPEPIFRELFSATFTHYETADLAMEGVDHHVNLEHLPFPAQSYDVVFASHVLEHIANDAAAIAEIRRILKPEGVAILPVPIVSEQTIEYGEARAEEHYHVRSPGPDYIDRYKSVFSEVVTYTSDQYPEQHQLFARSADNGEIVGDVVPVCYV